MGGGRPRELTIFALPGVGPIRDMPPSTARRQSSSRAPVSTEEPALTVSPILRAPASPHPASMYS